MNSEISESGELKNIISLVKHPLSHASYRAECKKTLDEFGVLVLPDFLLPDVIQQVANEGQENQHLAYYTANDHNVYLKPFSDEFSEDHPRNKLVKSSKGCITTDQIPENSALRTLYNSFEFKAFLAAVLEEASLHEYADPLSSINLHYAAAGQELGWHFDNSSFAITLLIQKPEGGANFEYVKDVRDADAGHMNYEGTRKILGGNATVRNLDMNPGALVLFRGRNSIHRVTPTIGDVTRMLVVLAYNTEPGIELSESARMTFYGRLG